MNHPNQYRDTLPQGDLAVGLDRVRTGVALLPPDQQELLIWLHGYAAQVLRTRQRLCTELGYDWSVIIRLWDGKYPGDVNAVLEAVTRLKQKADRARGSEFISTQVTRRIMAACDRARDVGDMVHICAKSRRGKTVTLKEWQALNNHGLSIYVDLPVPCSRRTLVDELARVLGRGSRAWRKGHQTQAAVEASLDRRNVLILDEAGRLLPSGSSTTFSAAEYVRRLHDTIGCGIVLSTTNLFRTEMERGSHQTYLEQLLGRIEEPVYVPNEVTLSECREIAQHFNPKAGGDLIKAMRAFANSGRGGLGTAIRLLRQAAAGAADVGEAVTLDHWDAAVELRTGDQAWED